jgi:hypothetical protein
MSSKSHATIPLIEISGLRKVCFYLVFQVAVAWLTELISLTVSFAKRLISLTGGVNVMAGEQADSL